LCHLYKNGLHFGRAARECVFRRRVYRNTRLRQPQVWSTICLRLFRFCYLLLYLKYNSTHTHEETNTYRNHGNFFAAFCTSKAAPMVLERAWYGSGKAFNDKYGIDVLDDVQALVHPINGEGYLDERDSTNPIIFPPTLIIFSPFLFFVQVISQSTRR
jgi:hypothetical protein